LGACNPRFAYEALVINDKIGVFLPCNIVVQQHGNDDVEISIINPEELMHDINDLDVRTFSIEIKESMMNVLHRV
jgi:uncharacterized protein (DUF302 family)